MRKMGLVVGSVSFTKTKVFYCNLVRGRGSAQYPSFFIGFSVVKVVNA